MDLVKLVGVPFAVAPAAEDVRLGAEAGARLLRVFRMPVSPDVLLRLMHRQPLSEAPTLHRWRRQIQGLLSWVG